MNDLAIKCVEWRYLLGRSTATCSDGRLKIWDEHETLVFPAPAAEIFERIEARKAVSQ